jgi:hypothetical protein
LYVLILFVIDGNFKSSLRYRVSLSNLRIFSSHSFFQDTCLSHFKEGREQVEALIIRGATKWEARYLLLDCLHRIDTYGSSIHAFEARSYFLCSRGVIAESLRSGLAPFLNQMMIICLAFLPGMMSGKIFIYFLVAPILALRLSVRQYLNHAKLDMHHCLPSNIRQVKFSAVRGPMCLHIIKLCFWFSLSLRRC